MGHVAITELLIQYGAKLTEITYDNSTPLHLAAQGKNVQVVEYLLSLAHSRYLRDNYGRLPLHLAAQGGHDKTALHIAAEDGQFEIVKLLLKNGADPRAVDNENHTPLELTSDDRVI
ncbi:hypothetical protein J3458_019642 [Metarhizium acridum]|uniref:uncharacterized protein n=1 Tax=Metarhizium acridum TaxID=92637 RepID=UPI001C6D1CE3|nr:hypothetical protein J3458_019642 [Metarhizium acridum]